MKVIIKQHPGTGLWVTSDGRVIMPPCPKYPKFRFTFGSKDKLTGYMTVGYHGKHYLVHRLIAETHISNPEGYPTVDHKNRIKTANFVENLCWASYSMQNSNKQSVDASLAQYGVRACEDKTAYNREYNTKNAERHRALCREYRARQKELGRRYRTCPDGKRKWLTREEFFKEYGYWPKK